MSRDEIDWESVGWKVGKLKEDAGGLKSDSYGKVN